MELKILVVSKSDYNRFSAKGKNDYTESGVTLYEPETVIPVVVKGLGCMANARIHKVTITAAGTTVTFTFEEIAKSTSDAVYTLYKNYNVQKSDVSTKFDTDDAGIPGIYTASSGRRYTLDD